MSAFLNGPDDDFVTVFPTVSSEQMIHLEDLHPNVFMLGMLPDSLVSVEWYGNHAVVLVQ